MKPIFPAIQSSSLTVFNRRELVRFGCQFRKGSVLATKNTGKMKLSQFASLF